MGRLDNRFYREAAGKDGQGWGSRISHVAATHQKLFAKVKTSGPFDFTQERHVPSQTAT
ncbi:MAG: hypothetical protein R3F14_13970 [Polyangiaceae bacterium]